MATKKPVKETARLTIVCDSANDCTVRVKGERFDLITAFAALLELEQEDNEFRNMMALAMKMVLDKDKKKKKKLATKKKVAVKKKK